jgi:hypothetical protein
MTPRNQNLGRVGGGIAAVALGALWLLRARDTMQIARLRSELESAAGRPVERFCPELVADLPGPARRYFLHAIRPETPLAHAAQLTMAGESRLGPRLPWLPFRARQLLAPPDGLVWEANVGQGLTRFAGADTYAHGRGQVAFRLWDLLPVARAGGPDVSRAARGRLAIESIWQPAALLPQRGVTWTSIDDRTARALVPIDGETIPLTLTIASDGGLQRVTMKRWGNLTPDGQYASIPFGADACAERTFGGYTVPSDLRVSWWYGTERAFPFFRASLAQATYQPLAGGPIAPGLMVGCMRSREGDAGDLSVLRARSRRDHPRG